MHTRLMLPPTVHILDIPKQPIFLIRILHKITDPNSLQDISMGYKILNNKIRRDRFQLIIEDRAYKIKWEK